MDVQPPVALFLPAHDEQATVAAVVRRAPAEVDGHPVTVVVVDDGSTDATAAEAAAAGATVVTTAHAGLGAAVRRGLAEAVAAGAVAVAFCDADGEYDPAELGRLVGPILAGEADYVVGSRFAGGPRRMRPHRLAGNRALTAALSLVAGRRISDGQSGYRALSAAAATAAEVVHDYNYAQVLTLDLLAKGFRYAEVPISYRWRTAGRSFVRLGPYLRRVVPAVYEELRTGAWAPPHLATSASRSSGATGALCSKSPHASLGTIHMTSNSVPSGSTA
jgi:glycosyltransferase involved in cell wall biosynthesis